VRDSKESTITTKTFSILWDRLYMDKPMPMYFMKNSFKKARYI